MQKITTRIINKVVDGNSFKVCTPTHESALMADAITIFNC